MPNISAPSHAGPTHAHAVPVAPAAPAAPAAPPPPVLPGRRRPISEGPGFRDAPFAAVRQRLCTLAATIDHKHPPRRAAH